MIDQLKAILQEALDKLSAVSIPSLPRDGMTVRQALETLRVECEGMVCLKLEFKSYGQGSPFTLEYAAYNQGSNWSQDRESLTKALAEVLPEKTKAPQPDALQTVDSVLESVTEPLPFPF